MLEIHLYNSEHAQTYTYIKYDTCLVPYFPNSPNIINTLNSKHYLLYVLRTQMFHQHFAFQVLSVDIYLSSEITPGINVIYSENYLG